MAELTDALNQLLEGQTGRISRRIGADEAQTRTAVQAAVPALLAALSGEAERGGGLGQAIERDHDGSILDQLDAYLGGTASLSPRTTNGAGILDHVLGGQQDQMARALSSKTGIDMGTILQLLPLLAPILMGMLGRRGRTSAGGSSGPRTDGGGGGGSFSLDDITDMLGREKRDTKSRNPDIGDILDSFAKGSTR